MKKIVLLFILSALQLHAMKHGMVSMSGSEFLNHLKSTTHEFKDNGDSFECGGGNYGPRHVFKKTEFNLEAPQQISNKECKGKKILVVGCGHVPLQKAYEISKSIVSDNQNPMGRILYPLPHEHNHCTTWDTNELLNADIKEDFIYPETETLEKYKGYFEHIIFESMLTSFSCNAQVLKNAAHMLKTKGVLWVTTGSVDTEQAILTSKQFSPLESGRIYIPFIGGTPSYGIKAVKIENCCGASECINAGSKQCSRCRKAYYCSTECQKKDWPRHKNSCKSVNDK